MFNSKLNYYLKGINKIRRQVLNKDDPYYLTSEIEELLAKIRLEQESLTDYSANWAHNFKLQQRAITLFFWQKVRLWFIITLLSFIFLLASVAQITYFVPLAVGGGVMAFIMPPIIATILTVKNYPLLQQWLKSKLHLKGENESQNYQIELEKLASKLIEIKNNLNSNKKNKKSISVLTEEEQMELLQNLAQKYLTMDDTSLREVVKRKVNSLAQLKQAAKKGTDPFQQAKILNAMALIWHQLDELDQYLGKNAEPSLKRTKRIM